MQREEQMRRRNPKAHTAMVSARREKGLRSLQQNAPLHNPTPPASVNPINSIQRVRWDAPMIATGEMLHLPSTASDVTLGTESMLDAPLVTNRGEAMSINLDEPESGPLFSTSGTGEDTSVPAPKQTQSSLDVPQWLSGTPKLTAHDLQNHIDKSITVVANNQVAQREETCDTSRSPKLDAPTNNLEGGRVQPNDTVSGQPGPTHGPTETATGVTRHGPGHHQTGLGSLNGSNSHDKHKTESNGPRLKLVRPSNGMVNGSQENRGRRKRSASAENKNPKKKMKAAPATENFFVDLLRREAARSSRGGSAA